MRNDDYFVGRVEAFIKQERLISKDGLHLVALSGGADSVALLLVLQQLGYRIEAVHCNFHLRGEESDRDESFVKNLCSEKGIELHLIHFDTEEYARIHQVSIEMAARDLRYRYFEQLRQDIGASTVCVAHHRDDAVETLLMNLMRGAGIHGLTGIRPKNGAVVRPLLGVCRRDIEEFLHSIGQDYVIDSTNLEPDVLRNKVRLQLLPLIEELLPGSNGNMARSATYLTEAEKVYNAYMAPCQDKSPSFTLSKEAFLASPSPLCLLYERLTPLGFNRSQVAQVLDHFLTSSTVTSGRTFQSATHTLLIDREAMVVTPTLQPMKPLKIPETGTYCLDETARIRVESLQVDKVSASEGLASPLQLVSKDSSVATLDAVDIVFPLTVRPVCEGDRFQPFGMKGSKLVSDFLTDRKCSLLEKRRQLVVTDASDRILWLVGLRTDHRFRITATTATILRISQILS